MKNADADPQQYSRPYLALYQYRLTESRGDGQRNSCRTDFNVLQLLLLEMLSSSRIDQSLREEDLNAGFPI